MNRLWYILSGDRYCDRLIDRAHVEYDEWAKRRREIRANLWGNERAEQANAHQRELNRFWNQSILAQQAAQTRNPFGLCFGLGLDSALGGLMGSQPAKPASSGCHCPGCGRALYVH